MNTKQILTISVSILCLLIITQHSKAQNKTNEFGLVLGSSSYMGDINHSKLFYSPSLAYGVLYRHNINNRNSYRVQLSRQPITGNDLDFTSGYQQTRAHSFSNTIYELAGQYELHFLEYNPRKHLNFTTYMIFGLAAIMTSSPDQKYALSIPGGFGFKYGIGKRLTVGAEWTYKKTFTDHLDLLPENTYDPNLNPQSVKQRTSDVSKDWYSFAGVVISYNFASSKKWCPAYDRRKKK